jgi:hypothetical protein
VPIGFIESPFSGMGPENSTQRYKGASLKIFMPLSHPPCPLLSPKSGERRGVNPEI